MVQAGVPVSTPRPATQASRQAAAPRSLFGVRGVPSPSPGPGPVAEPPGALLAPARVAVRGLGASWSEVTGEKKSAILIYLFRIASDELL